MIAQLISPEARLRTLKGDFETFVKKNAVLQCAAVYDRLAAVLPKLDEPVAVSFVGDFKTGKSSTLNAIVGGGRALSPVDPRPASALTCYFRYGDRERVRFVRQDGVVEETTFDEFGRIVNQQAETPASVAKRKTLSHAEVFYPAEILREVVLVDTPGLGSLSQSDDERALAHIAQADALCWLFDANTGAVSTETLGRIRRALPHVRAAWAVVNRCDDLAPSERRAVIQAIHREVGQHFRQVFGYSARLAALQATGRPLPADETTGLDLRLIDQIIAAVREETRELRVARAARELAAAIEVAVAVAQGHHGEFQAERAFLLQSAIPELRLGAQAMRASHVEAFRRVDEELDSVVDCLVRTLPDAFPRKDGVFVDDYELNLQELTNRRNALARELSQVTDGWVNAVEQRLAVAYTRIRQYMDLAMKEGRLPPGSVDFDEIEAMGFVVPHRLTAPLVNFTSRLCGGLAALSFTAQHAEGVRKLFNTGSREAVTDLVTVVSNDGEDLRRLEAMLDNEDEVIWTCFPYSVVVASATSRAKELATDEAAARGLVQDLARFAAEARVLTEPARK